MVIFIILNVDDILLIRNDIRLLFINQSLVVYSVIDDTFGRNTIDS